MAYDPIVAEIRCPVHGFIGITDLERQVIDQQAFQRLRRIKQLAWTDYVYPGASHSRFEHSLGVMSVASRLFEAVVDSSGSILKETYGYTNSGLARDWQIVRLAALLHDVGHAPFSHATEHLLPIKTHENYSLFAEEGSQPKIEQFEHEDYSVAIIEKILADVIEAHPLNRRNAKITAKEVTALIAKTAPAGASLFWKDVISGHRLKQFRKKARANLRKEQKMPAEMMIQRLALFSELAGQVRLGRTAIMKLCFFLQESKKVPLGYQFSIYSYGPFDSDVLTDLSAAVQMNVLKSEVVYYPSGYGYEYSRGTDESVRTLAADFLNANRVSIQWAITNFGRKTAGELELLSTTLFVAKFNNPKDATALIDQVQLIKPHFSTEQIRQGFQELVTLNVLRAAPG